MAKDPAEVLKLVRADLAENPDISTKALYEKARERDPSIGELTVRQFHARYPLQVKRQMAAARKKTSGQHDPRSKAQPRRKTPKIDRAAVRQVLLTLAEDVAAAEGKVAMIKLLAALDSYVDQLEEAVTSRSQSR